MKSLEKNVSGFEPPTDAVFIFKVIRTWDGKARKLPSRRRGANFKQRYVALVAHHVEVRTADTVACVWMTSPPPRLPGVVLPPRTVLIRDVAANLAGRRQDKAITGRKMAYPSLIFATYLLCLCCTFILTNLNKILIVGLPLHSTQSELRDTEYARIPM